ncbi:MAG TPA: NAD(P)H-binding protein [Actinocatenispora sp.]
MGSIVVYGAGGRAGRAVVTEARRRGYAVTAVVREPARHADLAAGGVRLVAGDVTDADAVAAAGRGHDAAVSAVYDAVADQSTFFAAAGTALVTGLTAVGVPRVVSVGLASVLPTASGTPLMDTAGYPTGYRTFFLGHAAGTAALAAGTLDWLVLSPSGDFDHDGHPTGRYRVAPGDAAARITYPDFAVAVLDEIAAPAYHRTHVGVTSG